MDSLPSLLSTVALGELNVFIQDFFFDLSFDLRPISKIWFNKTFICVVIDDLI
jgi:hypothetical protein